MNSTNSKPKKIKWRPAQIEAITERDKTVLVSAAAGSGKTATLTERIIRRIIDDGADISKMLVVTFTRASASDLKAKIFEAVSKNLALDPQNENLTNTMAKLNNAKISTIDSFYFDVLKSNFSQANVSPTVKIMDGGEYTLLAKKTMNSVIDDFYQDNDDFPLFVECFTSVRSLNTLNEGFLALYGNLCDVPEGIEFLKTFADGSEVTEEGFEPFSSPWGDRLKECSLDFFKHYKLFFEKATEKLKEDELTKEKYLPSFAHDLDFCNKLICALSSEKIGYLDIQTLLNGNKAVALKSIPSAKATTDTLMLKEMRNSYSDALKKHISTYYSLSVDSFAKEIKETQKHTYMLYELLKEFDLRISEQKKRLNALTFNDIKRKTYELLVCDGKPTETAKSIENQYTDIFIDEYQDVDPIQDEIFKAISTPTNRFLVGDIKQCIYKFRGAKPSLFSDYREAFAREDMQNARTIFMSENFRCDENIISFTNAVCSKIFKAADGAVKYCDDDDLKYTKNKITDNVLNAKASVRILSINTKKNAAATEGGDSSDESERVKEEWESSYVASIVASLIGKEKKANGELIEAGDIAILFRQNKSSPVFASALKSLGIKVAEPEAVQYFESDDVLLMLAILNAIDNPERDVYLAGALRSPLFKFSAEELLRIRREYPEPSSLFGGVSQYANERDDGLSQKCKSFIETLLEWQRYASALSIDRFLLTLFNDDRFIASGILSSQNSDGEGGNVLLLYEYARVFSGSSYKGIYEFIEYVNSLIEENKSFPSASKAKSASRVSLMTIHKSKGLEFPVCIVAGMGTAFSKNENKKSLVFKHPEGIAMKLADGSGFAQINTPMRSAILESVFKESAEENIRVLYVALTRARERLFVIGSTSTAKDDIQSVYAKKQFSVDRYSVLTVCNSFLDWIMLYLNGANPPFVDFSVLDANDISLILPALTLEEEEQAKSDSSDIDGELTKKLSDAFKFKYKYSALSEIPSKLSVSSLSATEPSSTELNGNGDKSENTENTENADFTPAKIPAFFSEDGSAEVSSAERGTATHLFLQFCDFKNLAERGVDEELYRLLEMGFLQSDSEKLIFKKELEKFAKSKFIEQIIGAEKVIREERFNVLLDPKIYVSDEEILRLMGDEKLAVQGVIDLVLIEKDGSIRLFDYKTDRLSGFENPKRELTLRYSKQLSCYARAIELMFERKCKSVQIYSTQLGKLYDIDTLDVE